MTTKQAPIPVTDVTEAFTVKGTGTINLGQRGSAKKGDVWLDKDGKRRLILCIATGQVWFVCGTQAYIQSVEDFADDVGFAQTYAKVAPGMKVAAQLIETEMAFLEALVSSLGWPLFLAITGKDVVVFAVQHYKDFPKWQAAAKGALLGREILKTHAPTLWNAILAAAAFDFLDKWQSSPASMLSVKDTAKLLGGLLGMAATAGVATVFAALKTAASLLAKAAVTTAKVMAPGVGKTYKEPQELVATFQRMRVAISLVTAQKMIEEYRAHPVDVEKGLKYLLEGLQVVAKLREPKAA